MNPTIRSDYLDFLRRYWPNVQSEAQNWLNQLRINAFDHVNAQRLPTRRDEDWRFTDISPLTQLTYSPAKPEYNLQASDLTHWQLKEAKNRLVFVDGHYAEHLSVIDNSLQLVIGNLPDFASTHREMLEAQLGCHATSDCNVFTALNTAFLHDGAVIIVPKNTVVEEPVHILFIATQSEVTGYPRCLVLGEAGSQITLIEDHVALTQSAYVTNSVTEIDLADNASVKHIRIQRDNALAFHMASCAVSLARASNYQSISISLGAQISRYNLGIRLMGEAAECAVSGLALIGDRQLADTHTCIDHSKPNGISHQQHRCIVDDSAHAVFNGKIIVRPYAQRTNSAQSSRNLLLSKTAQIDTKPQLEIFANDVKCAHGATVGQLDPDEIFYLKSRGLPDLVARDLLTYAFGAEIIQRIPVASLKQRLEQAILCRTQRQS
ncbi:MAG: Fe-S cluster assembly protein SufD [Nitrosomonas sp.]|nr:MAG: Fe-S cluster assembly protein SufD [Nitrosomonas sp.]